MARPASGEIHHPDGRVELADPARIAGSPLTNADLAPVAVRDRNWTTYNYAALWISMAHCIPTYMLASGLMASGMNWAQAIVTILLGNTIVLVPILLNSHAGTRYGIPFPVFARAAYGTAGSNLPALLRAERAERSEPAERPSPRISSARATIFSNIAPVSPPFAGRFERQTSGSSADRMSAKSPSLLTLSGANSVMSTGPAQSSRCLIRSHERSLPPGDQPPFVRTSTQEPFNL